MTQSDFEKYAKLIVNVGANVQPGQKVRLTADVDQEKLVSAIVKECYKAGAKFVEMFWHSGSIEKLHYQFADEETLSTVLPWEEERAKQMVKDLPVRIYIDSSDPDELNGIDAKLLSNVNKSRSNVLKKYRDEIDGKHQWLIVAAASDKWAKKVFPNLPADQAKQKLWDAIFKCAYVDSEDPVKVWRDHTESLEKKAAWLNKQNFDYLTYKSKNGTDFKVWLIDSAKWGSAHDKNYDNGQMFVPNMPTEEIFTSPMRGKCEGRLVATKPLSWSGQLIDDFMIEFKNGKAVKCEAKIGKDILEKMITMDEGASMLGEVALVPKESPINKLNILFYSTLFDENACCHVALGRGFGEVLDGFLEMTNEQRTQKGINDSIIHVDFMVGSDDLEIIGTRHDGTNEKIFVNGTWNKDIDELN